MPSEESEREGDAAKDAKDAKAGDRSPEGAKSADEESSHEDRISFNSLNSVEKEVLLKKLRKEILKDVEKTESCCYSFLDWVFEQFSYLKADPPSVILFSNLDYIGKHCNAPDLFVREGSPETTNMYFESIAGSVEPDYASGELNIYCLADATLRYVSEKIEFFDCELYKRLSEVWESDEERDFVMRRLPFIIKNRDTLIAVRDLFERMEENRESNNVGESKMAEIWASAIVKWSLCKETDPVAPGQKTQILKSLFDREFVYVPMSFYD